MGRRQTGTSSVIVWRKVLQETLGSTIHADVTLTPNNIVLGQVQYIFLRQQYAGQTIPIHGGPISPLTGSAVNVMVPDTTSSEV